MYRFRFMKGAILDMIINYITRVYYNSNIDNVWVCLPPTCAFFLMCNAELNDKVKVMKQNLQSVKHCNCKYDRTQFDKLQFVLAVL